ncbi:MAG: hypothetical protein K2R98_32975 [Gemmataceae bacterium]|nr:hypothetical protein [Gemmataceae bacterium]
MPERSPSNGQPINPSVAYERTDVAFRGTVLFGGGLILLLALTAVGISLLLSSFETSAQRQQTAPTMRASEAPSGLPPSPRLEGIDLERSEHDVGRTWEVPARQQVAQEEAHLQRYGWVDRPGGRVSIPIDEAMKIVAGRLGSGGKAVVDEFQQSPSRSSSGQQPRGGRP